MQMTFPEAHFDDAFRYLLAGEQALGLGISGKHLTAALERLHTFEQMLPSPERRSRKQTAARELLAATAAERLYFYIVQRELCGFLDHQMVFSTWSIPIDVQARMGASCERSSET